MTRDLCHGRKAKYVRRTTAYKATRNGRLTGPGHYDYPGVDDGSRCPQRGGARCGWNAATNRCAKGHDNKQGWCEIGGKKGTRKSPNRKRRCVKSPFATRFLGAPKAARSPKGVRKARKSPKKARKSARKSPKKARKSPKKARKSPKKKSKRGQGMKGYDYYDPMETRRKPGRKVKGAEGLAALGYGGNRQQQQQQQQQQRQQQRQQQQRQQQQTTTT